MSEAVTPLKGAERIRALTNEDAIFQAFDAYPWKKDAMFMSGLLALLGNPADFGADAVPTMNSMATQARIFYYAQRVGVVIDYNKYYAWLENHPRHRRPMFHPDTLSDPPPTHPNDHQLSEVTDKLSRLDAVPPTEKEKEKKGWKGKGKGKEKEDQMEKGKEKGKQKENQMQTEMEMENGKENETETETDLGSGQPSSASSPQPSSKDKRKEKEVLSQAGSSSADTIQAGMHPTHPKEQERGRQSPSELNTPTTSLPSWQTAAPTAELYVHRVDPRDPSDPRDSSDSSDSSLGPDEPSYPLRFAEMIRMLQENVAIPGIRQIPDTVTRDAAARPFGARIAPRKPWEQMTPSAQPENYSTPHDKRGLEFPPVEG